MASVCTSVLFINLWIAWYAFHLLFTSMMQISACPGETVSPLTECVAVIPKEKHCCLSVNLSLLMGMETHWIRASSDIVTLPLLLE